MQTTTRGADIVTQDPSLAQTAQEPDVELVRRACGGDLAAYSALVERHKRAVYSIVSRMVTNKDDVDDLVQEIFVTAYRSIGRFRGKSAYSTWLYRIAVNASIKCSKKMKARQSISIDDPETGIADTLASSAGAGPPEAAEQCERREAVRKAIERLSEKHRTAVVLHYFEDYTCEQIAGILNCSMGTVWSRLHYACKKLRAQLEWLETA
ncbi:MAG: sigma-70 family RNA polymerase sigma factor [Armatimonadetes bacterium]|nr:sigma-70 family RNA polymerase sigma factor [Armatimonadota bacterium]